MATDFHIPLEDYHEHMYKKFEEKSGFYTGRMDQLTSKEVDLINEIPWDLTFYYLLPFSKNVCEVFINDKEGEIYSVKKPTLLKSGLGYGSIISGTSFDWAIVEGDGKSEEKKEETLLLITDESGRHMLPYFANYYKNIYYINLSWNEVLGTDKQNLETIFKDYNIKDVVYGQNANMMGDSGYQAAINSLLRQGEIFDD